MASSEKDIRDLTLPQGNSPEFDGSVYPRLRRLDCSARNCEIVDLLDNIELGELNCSMNALSSLNLSNCENLTSLDCSFNILAELSLPSISDIQILDCSHNQLTSLDLRGAPDLKELYCDANEELSSLLFPSSQGKPIILEFLDISHTSLSPEWLEKTPLFPLPAEGCEDQLFIFGTPLADNAPALSRFRESGWTPVIEEE